MQELWSHLGISPVGALSVVIASTVLYLCLAAVLRVYGQQLLGGLSTFSLAVMTLLGAITARAALGDSPTMAGGLVAIFTLLALERFLGRMANLRPGLGLAQRSPVLLMIGPSVREEALRRSRMTHAQLWSQLRQAGVTSRHDVRLVVLENRGRLTVVRTGQAVDRAFLLDVRGAEDVPAEWLERGAEAG